MLQQYLNTAIAIFERWIFSHTSKMEAFYKQPHTNMPGIRIYKKKQQNGGPK